MTTKASKSPKSTSSPSSLIIELAKSFAPYVLIASNDDTRRTRATDFFIKTAKDTEELEVVTFQCDSETNNKLKNEASALSLFSRRKIILCKGFNNLIAEQQKDIVKTLETISGKTSVVLTSTHLPSTSITRKFFEKNSKLIEIEDLKGFPLRKWVLKEFNLMLQIKCLELRVLDFFFFLLFL